MMFYIKHFLFSSRRVLGCEGGKGASRDGGGRGGGEGRSLHLDDLRHRVRRVWWVLLDAHHLPGHDEL